MTQQKPRNPDIDFGFFAQIPRIVRTDYKSLTSVQKWLYVCLKDLCGETGTCYRTLRVLADETGISTGMLSESIAALHKEGLIHAEKKKRSIGGKEVWHITIVDIWKANAKAHPTKRSHSEQTIENVHSVNNNVHHVNDDTSECSHSEPECSHSETEEVSSEAISFTEEISGEEREREVADATARSQSSSQNDLSEETEKREAVKASQKGHRDGNNHLFPGSNHSDTRPHASIDIPSPSGDTDRVAPPQSPKDTNKVTEPPAPRKPPTNTVPKRPRPQQQELTDEIPGPEIPEKAIAIMDRWDSVHKKPAPRTLKTIQAAQLLMVYDPSEDELRECEKWLYTTDRPGKPWYRSHGVHLPDIAEKIGSWQSLQNAPPAKPEKEPSNEHRVSSFGTPGYNFADEFYPSEAEKKAYYAAHPQGVKS